MQFTRKRIIGAILLVLVLFIRVFSANKERVETHYSTGIYPPVGAFFRYVFGWIPFSFGDLLYGLLIGWLIWKLFRHTRFIFRRRITKRSVLTALEKLLLLTLMLYVSFNLLWGINYNRKGIADQIGLKMEKYSQADLELMNGMLVTKLNAAKQTLVLNKTEYPRNAQLFKKVERAYARLDSVYPFLEYRPTSLKISLWGWLGNYMGFTGYYNPFTGEAQVNTTGPKFLLPYTSCHEVAHQLGYAKEMEANFVGYLAASNSRDTLFHYSVYLDLFLYSNRNLFKTDSAKANAFTRSLLPEVKADIKEWRAFNRRHRNPIEPLVRWVYGKYLQGNQQPQGILSYDEVTSFIIAYYKKFGKI